MSKRFMISILIVSVLFVVGCLAEEPRDIPDPVTQVTHDELTIHITNTALYDGDLVIDFLITAADSQLEPSYRIRMPWIIRDQAGTEYESSHSSFYSVLDSDGSPLPRQQILQVTFRGVPADADYFDVDAVIEPQYLIPSPDGYGFEVLFENMDLDNPEPQVVRNLGFTFTAWSRRLTEEELSVTVRTEAAQALLDSMTYSLDSTAKDNLGNLYTQYRSQRPDQPERIREETLIFSNVTSEATTITMRYPVHVRGTVPSQVLFLFTDIPSPATTG